MIDFDGQIELLAKHHDRRNFSCGQAPLDNYLRRLARQHAVSKISRSYMACKADRILGYYSLAMSAIRRDQLPQPHQKRFPNYPVPVARAMSAIRRDQLPQPHQKRFPNYPVPVARLARLAVDQSQQGKGLGKLLLLDALYRCHRLSEEIGAVGVIVDAKNVSAQNFYIQMDFEAFPETPSTLWLPDQAIANLFSR